MERKIVFSVATTQSRHVLETSATTLGELKADMRAANIPYEGLVFNEGISKTILNDDNSQLPTNVMFKGEPTNNLVFVLTHPETKHKSGADRMHLYDLIKTNNLSDKIKNHFNKNYTNIATDVLEDFINKELNIYKGCTETEKDNCNNNSYVTKETLREVIHRLFEDLDFDIDYVLRAISIEPISNESMAKSPYNNDELEDIISGI